MTRMISNRSVRSELSLPRAQELFVARAREEFSAPGVIRLIRVIRSKQSVAAGASGIVAPGDRNHSRLPGNSWVNQRSLGSREAFVSGRNDQRNQAALWPNPL